MPVTRRLPFSVWKGVAKVEEYRSNSHRSREEKRVEKAVTGPVKTRKKSEARKFADVFIQEDVSSVKSYILMEVLVPAIKKALSDIVKDGIDMILYGEAGRNKRNSPGSKVSYQSYYNRDDRRDNLRPRTGYSYDDIILNSRGEAEEVLTRLDELISVYGLASVADFYDLVGVQGNYTDNNYGWTDIRSASVVHVRDGWMVKLPRALPLN